MDRRFTKFRLIPLVALVVGLALAVYTVLWFHVAAKVEDSIADWIEQRRAQGYAAAHARLSVTGYPLALRIDVEEPRLGRSDQAVAWNWRGDGLIARMRPWALARPTIELTGTQTLSFGGPGQERHYSAAAEVMRVALTLAPRLERVTADLRGLRVTGTAWPGEGALASASLRGAAPPPGAGSALTLVFDARGLTLPVAVGPLGRGIDRLAGEIALSQPWPSGGEGDALARWRDDGGTLEVARLSLRWGALDLTARGTLSLDALMRPIGAFSTSVRGVDRAIDALRQSGQLSPVEAMAAKIGLRLLAERDGRGSDSFTVPVTLQDGRLYFDRFAVGRVGSLRLPAGPPAVPATPAARLKGAALRPGRPR